MGYRVAVVGATGEVGRTFLKVLEERKFPVDELVLFASERSWGKRLTFRGEEHTVEVLTKARTLKNIDIALFSAGGSVSKEYAPLFAKEGAVVIDNSSAWRMDPKVPLVVPEVNPEDVRMFKEKGIVANPNCSTIQMVVALKPIYDEVGVKRVVVATYQSVSGAGAKAIRELENQTRAWCGGEPFPKAEHIPRRIAFSVVPHIDVFVEGGYTREEMKMLNETRKIMHDDGIKVSATCVRVPVFYGHSEALHIETGRDISPERAKEVLSRAPGVVVREYPTPEDVEGRDEVFVGRIREDRVFSPGIAMWVVADNIRKGAATNAVQIAELLVSEGLV
ncbi:MAG TPA: aspartate-semialdehyde dehydrogenase [Aquifex aeolicus]|nr:aspartate-semialdehyde dehydrogenase [Aquifex aeolicus]